MKETELTRTLIENKKTDSPNESSDKDFSYADAVKLSPIVLKPNSKQTLSKDQINEKMSQALDKIKVASAKVTKNGKILVKVPHKGNESEAKETLMSTFSGHFCLDEVKKLLPKITMTNVPNDMIDEALVTKICDKDAFLNSKINNDTTFSVIKSWTSKKYTGTQNYKT